MQSIPLTKPWLGEAEAEAAQGVILSGAISQGPQVEAFEEEFALYVGAKHACAVSSSSAALHLALLAVGVQPGDEVITASHSYIATANSIRYCGAIPVFVDIEPQTYNINPLLIEQAISDRTRAILVVHQMGMPCDLYAIIHLAQRYSLPVIEDATSAVGSEILWNAQWQKIGKPHGDIACFSFDSQQVITTGGGGMLTTNNSEWDQQFRRWREHGKSIADRLRHGSQEVLFESYPLLGYDYRLTDIQAAIGREQLNRLPTILGRRRLLAGRYQEKLSNVPELQLPFEPDWGWSNWQSYCVRLPPQSNQRQVIQTLLNAGISTRRGIMSAHREPIYLEEAWSCGPNRYICDCPPLSCQNLRESEQAQAQSILLPIFPELSEEQQDFIIAQIKEIFQP